LTEGGTLRFGLRNVYPDDEELSNIYGMLKGIDAVVYRSARALRFEPVLYLYYEVNGDLPEGEFSYFRLTWTILRRTPLLLSGFYAWMVGSSCANIGVVQGFAAFSGKT